MPTPSSNRLVQIAVFTAVLVLIHLINVIAGMWLTRYGVVPRSTTGLRGILFSPLLHTSWAHLIANLPPLAVMLCVLSFTKGRALWATTGLIWVASGIAVWLVGRPNSLQVGASGLIYGLAAYLITAGWTHRDVKSALAALVVAVLYGGIVWGILPLTQGVSWEGHLCGAIAGFLIARMTEGLRA